MPSRVEIACVNPDQVRRIWPRVAPLLKSAIDRTRISSWDAVANDILFGNSLLWLCLDGDEIMCAGATSLQKTDFGMACVVVACGGSDMSRWLGLLEKVEAYAKAEGCRCVRIFGRRGWERVLDGYGATNVVLEKELT